MRADTNRGGDADVTGNAMRTVDDALYRRPYWTKAEILAVRYGR